MSNLTIFLLSALAGGIAGYFIAPGIPALDELSDRLRARYRACRDRVRP